MLAINMTYVPAAESSRVNIIAALKEDSERMFKANKVDESIDAIVQVLVIDPANTDAQNALTELLKDPSVPADYQILLYQFRDLLTVNSLLQYEIKTIGENIELLKRRLLHKGVDPEVFNQKLKNIEFTQMDQSKPSYLDEHEGMLLADVNAVLMEKNDYLADLKTQLFVQYGDILNIKNKYLKQKYDSPQRMGGGAYAKRFYTEDGIDLSKRQTIAIVKSRDNEVAEAKMFDALKSEIKQAEVKYDMLRSMADSKDEQIDRMQGEIVDLTLETAERARSMEQQDLKIAALKSELEEFTARFTLGQEIIKEKTDEINTLQDSLLKATQAHDLEIERIDTQLKLSQKMVERKALELNEVVNAQKGRSRTLFQKSDEILKLQGEVAEYRVKIETKDIALRHLQSEIRELEASRNTPTRTKKAELKEKGDDISQYEKNIKRLKTQLEEKRESLDLEISKYNELEVSFKQLKTKMNALQIAQRKKKKQLEKEIKNVNKSFEKKIKKLTVQLSKQEEIVEQQSQEILALKDKNTQLKQNEGRSIDEIQAAKKLAKANEYVSALKEEIKSVELARKKEAAKVLEQSSLIKKQLRQIAAFKKKNASQQVPAKEEMQADVNEKTVKKLAETSRRLKDLKEEIRGVQLSRKKEAAKVLEQSRLIEKQSKQIAALKKKAIEPSQKEKRVDVNGEITKKLAEANERLKELKEEIKKAQLAGNKRIAKSLNKEIKNAQDINKENVSKLAEKDEIIKRQSQVIIALKEKNAQLSKNRAYSAKDAKIIEKLAKTKKYFEKVKDNLKNIQLANKKKTERLLRKEKIIKQQKQEIAQLKQQNMLLSNNQPQVEMSGRETVELAKVNKNLKDLKVKLRNLRTANKEASAEHQRLVEEKEKDIKVHQKVLDQINKKYDKLNKKHTETVEQLALRKNAVKKLKDELSSHEKVASKAASFSNQVKLKNEQIDELEGILGIYKEELAEARGEIKDNLANISTLEEQLTLVQTELFEKDEALNKTQTNLDDLKTEIKDLKKELDLLRSLQNQANINSYTREQIAFRLKKIKSNLDLKFDEINTSHYNLPQEQIQRIKRILQAH